MTSKWHTSKTMMRGIFLKKYGSCVMSSCHVTSHDHKMAEFGENDLYLPNFDINFNLHVPNWNPIHFH